MKLLQQEAHMKDHNPHDPLNMIGEAYERLIELAMKNLHIQDGKKNAHSTTPHSNRISQFSSDILHRDSKQLRHPVYDQEFLVLLFTNILRTAADKTTMELNHLKQCKKLSDEFHSDELVDASTYYCDHCGSPNEISLPSYLEKCINCGHTTFRKLH